MNALQRFLGLGKKLSAAIGLFAVSIVIAGAQTAPGPAPHFDVVSVKITHTGQGGAGDAVPVNGTWRWKSITIPGIAAYAYGVSWNRVEGVPKTLQGPDPGFDIVAKLPVKTGVKDFRLMLQSLLADRFRAVIHTEVRDIPVNTIEVAKGGVKLRPASGQCVEVEGSAALPAPQHRCHEVVSRVSVSQDRTITWEYSGWSVSMADLAAKLSSNALMVDDTGLSGLYDIDVKVEVKQGQNDLESQNDWNYSVKTAWEKQAGLLIDLSKTKKRPATVVIVDHVELPEPN